MPAASYGLWGLRATLDYFNLDGIMPSVPYVSLHPPASRKPD